MLEVGSGTGQHAVYFAQALAHLTWQASDRAENLPGICQWLDEAQLPNTPPPVAFDVNDSKWPEGGYDAVFTANSLHIMAWEEVERLFAGLPRLVDVRATLAVYGPFNIGGKYTSASNADFDGWLKQRGAHMGIRDLEAVDSLASAVGFHLEANHALPANNRCVIWKK